MRNKLTTCLAVGLLSLVHAGTVLAQKSQGGAPGSVAPNQSVSPYLNLLRGGNPAVNYYGLVRPQQQAQEAFQNQDAINQDVYNSEQQGGQITTGHRSYFLNQNRFFLTTGTGSSGRTRSTGSSGAATSGAGQGLNQFYAYQSGGRSGGGRTAGGGGRRR